MFLIHKNKKIGKKMTKNINSEILLYREISEMEEDG